MVQQNGEKQQKNSPTKTTVADGMEIIYYTDPLCCWSWAMEPQWRRLQANIHPLPGITYKMGGLLPSWNSFNDTLSSIRKPVHMGPEWMHARHVSGVEIDNRIWITDPPSSSFPACIGVKSAELQSPAYGADYLYLARRAVMQEGRNIARTHEVLQLAARLAEAYPSFDAALFREDLLGRGLAAFKVDWQQAKYLGINRFPTLIFKFPDRPPVRLTGYQPYENLLKALQ